MSFILIIEDERPIAQSIAYTLKREGFEVITSLDGREGLRIAIGAPSPALIILDLMLPGLSGLDLCKQLRQQQTSWIPVIMLTARTEEIDRVIGLEIGADDYMTKPFSMRELVARVKATLRRPAQKPEIQQLTLSRHGIILDLNRHTVTRNDVELNLSPKEFDVLSLMMKNIGKALTRDEILNNVWGDEGAYRDPHTVDVHIRWLREKLEVDPAHPEFMMTVRGIGYKFNE
jgi:DNA-binding response OmpR family regulator